MAEYYALVEPTGRVAQIETKIFPIAPPFEWVECDSSVDTTYIYVGGTFVKISEYTA